jgi:hypothetical protein
MKSQVQCKTEDGCRGDGAPFRDAANGAERDFVRMLNHVAGNCREASSALASAMGQTMAQFGLSAIGLLSRTLEADFLLIPDLGMRPLLVLASARRSASPDQFVKPRLNRRGRIKARRGKLCTLQ